MLDENGQNLMIHNILENKTTEYKTHRNSPWFMLKLRKVFGKEAEEHRVSQLLFDNLVTKK